MRANEAACDSGNPYRRNKRAFDVFHNGVLRLDVDAIGSHARAQFAFEILHPLP